MINAALSKNSNRIEIFSTQNMALLNKQTKQNASERYFVKPSIDLNLIDYVQILLWQAEGINIKKRHSEILYKPVSPEKDLKLFEGVTSKGNIN